LQALLPAPVDPLAPLQVGALALPPSLELLLHPTTTATAASMAVATIDRIFMGLSSNDQSSRTPRGKATGKQSHVERLFELVGANDIRVQHPVCATCGLHNGAAGAGTAHPLPAPIDDDVLAAVDRHHHDLGHHGGPKQLQPTSPRHSTRLLATPAPRDES
jgi:hypothetical protein